MKWQIEDVRAVTVVTTVTRRPFRASCSFCERTFEARSWVSLSVAHEGVGGRTVDICQECAAANWDALLVRLEQVAEMFSASALQLAPE